ncbi:MAG: hypothetical protein AB7O62_01330, partial [Pirellulales bacterium]
HELVLPEQPTPVEDVEPRDGRKTGPGGMRLGGDRMGGGGMGGGPGGGMPGYSAHWYAPQAVSGQETNLGLVQQSLSGGFPLWRGEGAMLLATAGVQSTLFQTSAVFPDSGKAFPEQVWNIRLGLMATHQFDNGWTGSVMLNGGSASDQPFHSVREMNGTLLTFVRVPSGESNAWMFSLMYSPVSQIPFPIPGVAYQWQATDTLRINVGVPFQVFWQPTEDIYFQASYFPLTIVRLQSGWRVGSGPVTVFGGYDAANEAYLLADRIDYRERFFSYAQTFSAGLRYQLPRFGSLELSGGWAFDRYFFNGTGFSGRHYDRIDLSPGPYLAAAYRLSF